MVWLAVVHGGVSMFSAVLSAISIDGSQESVLESAMFKPAATLALNPKPVNPTIRAGTAIQFTRHGWECRLVVYRTVIWTRESDICSVWPRNGTGKNGRRRGLGRRRSVHLCVVGVEAIEQGLRLVAFVDSIDSLQQGQVRAFSEVVEEELTRFSFGAQPFVS